MNGTRLLPSKVDDMEVNPDLPPSYFPCLDARPGTKRSWRSVEVPFRDINRLRFFCEENRISALTVFQTAWSLVLRCYLGDPSVCFAYKSCNRAEDAESSLKLNPGISICQVDFRAANFISDVLRGVVTRYLQSPFQQPNSPSSFREAEHSDKPSLNSCLAYRDDGIQGWSALHRPVTWVCIDNGFQEVRIATSRMLALLARSFH